MEKRTVPVVYNDTVVPGLTLEIIEIKPNVWMTDGLEAGRMIRKLVRLGYAPPIGYETLLDKVRFVSPRTF